MTAANRPLASEGNTVSIDLDLIAKTLDDARIEKRSVAQFQPAFGLADGYAVQAKLIERRRTSGEHIIGLKMGFTSRAKMVQMGVADMIWGRLTDGMLVEEGGVADPADYIHPRAEPEIAFLLRRPLSGVVTPMQALDAVAAVAPAIEIIDSRYVDFRFTHAEVVADNCSGAGFVVGPWNRPDINTANLGMIISLDGRPQQFASSGALLGHPLRSLVAAARLVSAYGALGGEMEAGSIVLAGAGTPAIAVAPGQHVSLEVERLGQCAFTMAAA